MLKDLEQGSRYYIPFVSPYTSKGPYKAVVSSIAKKATLSYYGDFDMKSTFFDEVGIKTYLSMVTDDTDIYICHEITSLDPETVDDSGFIFIPKTLVDFANVIEYKETTRFTFTIEGVRRSFDNNEEKEEFLEDIKSSIPNALNTETILANDVLSVTTTEEDLIASEADLEAEAADRETYITQRENEKSNRAKADAEREMSYFARLKAVKARETAVAAKEKEIATKLAYASKTKEIANKFLCNVNELMNKMKIEQEELYDIATANHTTIPTWAEMMANVFDTASDGIDITSWQTMLEDYMKSGELPENFYDESECNCPVCGTARSKIS